MEPSTEKAVAVLTAATNAKASDIFIVAGLPLTYKVNGVLHSEGERLMPNTTELLIREIYALTDGRPIEPFLASGDDDFSFALPGLSR